MAIIKQFDKRSGITYFYESKSFWDKEKQQSVFDKLKIPKMSIRNSRAQSCGK